MIDFVCTSYDIDTGQELERYSWSPSGDEARIFFSFKERETLERGEFVEVDDKRRGVTVRYALLEKGRVA